MALLVANDIDAALASTKKEIEEGEAELKNLKDPQYLKGMVEKAKHEKALKFMWMDDDANNYWKEVKGNLELEKNADLPGLVNIYYRSQGFWDLVDKWAENELVKTDDKPEFFHGAESPNLTEPRAPEQLSELGSVLYTRIVEILPSGERKEAVAYDSTVHGDVTNFIQTTNAEGRSVWRTLDGRYEVQSTGGRIDKTRAAIDGDYQYQKGDLRVVVDPE